MLNFILFRRFLFNYCKMYYLWTLNIGSDLDFHTLCFGAILVFIISLALT